VIKSENVELRVQKFVEGSLAVCRTFHHVAVRLLTLFNHEGLLFPEVVFSLCAQIRPDLHVLHYHLRPLRHQFVLSKPPLLPLVRPNQIILDVIYIIDAALLPRLGDSQRKFVIERSASVYVRQPSSLPFVANFFRNPAKFAPTVVYLGLDGLVEDVWEVLVVSHIDRWGEP
jgi:hypothetical protein